MRRRDRVIRTAPALLLGLALAACSSGGFDPTDMFGGDWFNTKKRVEGDRRPVFPEGVPGVEQGVPPEMVRGQQPRSGSDGPMGLASNPAASPAATSAAEPAAAPEPAEKPRPQRRVTARTPAQPTRQDPPEAAVWPEPPRPQPQQARPSSSSPWPDPPRQPAQQAGQGSSTPWPDPRQPAQPAGAAAPTPWPDPPTPGTFSR